MDGFFFVGIPLTILVLAIFSASKLAKKTYAALKKYGKAWATLGGIAAFAVTFACFLAAIGLFIDLTWKR